MCMVPLIIAPSCRMRESLACPIGFVAIAASTHLRCFSYCINIYPLFNTNVFCCRMFLVTIPLNLPTGHTIILYFHIKTWDF